MVRGFVLRTMSLVLMSLSLFSPGWAQEDRAVQAAIETFKREFRLPREAEVRFVEKKDSPIPDFYSVRLTILTPTQEVPIILYVDSKGETVILGYLVVKGENVTKKEAGEPKPRKVDMAQLVVDRSAWRGGGEAKMTIVEFSNFQCRYCVQSWKKMKELLGKYPKEVRYVFKHFPLQPRGIPFELSEMVAATQDVSDEAFWAVHDFFFSDEGQTYVNRSREVVKKKIEAILREKGYDLKAFQASLDSGSGRKRVEEDVLAGNRIGVKATPSIIVNGDFIGSTLTDKMVENYLKN